VTPTRAAAVLVLALFASCGGALAAKNDAEQLMHPDAPPGRQTTWEELGDAATRLPLAAALGSALALRPRRRGTPVRQPVVVQTQIILAVVGAAIMLVIGASLARAFGVVGVAGLIRYRSKIDDPKDAVVMLSALAVGLAAGAGLFALATFTTAFLFVALLVSESFQPEKRNFELSVKLGENTTSLREQIESVLRRHRLDYELRAAAEDEVSYFVSAPQWIETDTVSNTLIALGPKGKGSVEWKEKQKIKAPLP